jgi:hypothetical protein
MLLLAFLLVVTLTVYYHLIHKRRGLPPGPTPIPFIGNIIDLVPYKGNLEQAFIDWGKKYGPVYSFWIGEIAIVNVVGYEKITELFQKDDGRFSGRFNFDENDNLMRGKHKIIE